MVELFAGEMIFTTGLASSCSPRCFIRSTITWGRGTIFKTCVGEGVTCEVAVVFLFSLLRPVHAPSQTSKRIEKNIGKFFSRRIVFLQRCKVHVWIGE